MTDWVQLVECKQTPGAVFTIYDYTKIAYPIDSGFCLREIVTSEEKPHFILRDHPCDHIHAMHCMPNNLISIESSNQDTQSWWVSFYNTAQNSHKQVRLNWTVGEVAKVKSVYQDGMLGVLASFSSQPAHQIAEMEELIFINCFSKRVIAQGLLSGPSAELTAGPNESLSILNTNTKSITRYKNQISDTGIGRIYKEYEINVDSLMRGEPQHQNNTIKTKRLTHKDQSQKNSTISANQYFAVQGHLWLENELMLWGDNKVSVVIERKICQELSDFHRLHQVMPLVCGFLVCDGCVLKVYKKRNINYQLICEFSDEYLMEATNLCLSPQEDILSYFCPMISSIIYSINFNQQIEQQCEALSKQGGINRGSSLKVAEIGHQKSFDFMVYGSEQGWFAAVNGAQVQLFSASNYQTFLSIKLEQQNRNSSADFLSQGVKIRHLAVHPNRPILAIALSKSIKIFYVTFNQAKLLKDIPLSMCGHLSFSHSGSMMTAIVSGKMGSKICVYRVNEIKNDFSLIQTLTIAKKVVTIAWDNLDTRLLAFHDTGYFQWSIESRFKTRKESQQDIGFHVRGGLVTKDDNIVLWGQNNILKFPLNENAATNIQAESKRKSSTTIKNIDVWEEYRFKNFKLDKVFHQHEYFYFVLKNGKICRSKTLDPQSGLPKAIDLQSKQTPVSSVLEKVPSNRNSTHSKVQEKKGQQQPESKNNESVFEVQLLQGNKLIYLSSELNIRFYEIEGTSHKSAMNEFITNIVGLQKKKIIQMLTKYEKYEAEVRGLKEKMNQVVSDFKMSVQEESKRQEQEYYNQFKEHVDRERKMKAQKSKLEEVMDKNIEIKEMEAMNQVKDLQKLYERKIALTTNKLLTEKEINFRDKVTAENKLKLLQMQHEDNIVVIRKQFENQVRRNCQNQDEMQEQMIKLKKEYESRLYDLEQENEMLLKSFQDKNDTAVGILKKSAVKWESMYNQCVSKKDNLQNDLESLKEKISHYNQQKEFIEKRKRESDRRCQHLTEQVSKIERVLEERNKSLQCYERRIMDLEKSNEILKYRVLELKQQNDPYEDEINQLKANLTDLEEEHESILKNFHENEQKLQVQKKEKAKIKQDNDGLTAKLKKLSKKYDDLVEKIRDITKFPIQEIRKELLVTVEKYSRPHEANSSQLKQRAESPLGQLNRIRDHLEVCLDEAVVTNKKNEEQKKLEVLKKNQENSQLITEINTLRKQIKIFQNQIKQKDLKINRILRGDTPSIGYASMKQERATTEAGSKEFRKTKGGRQTFYEKSLFKTNNWNEKRLKTEQGSRRKKSSHSMVRDRSIHGHLAIHSGGSNEDVEEYKRIIEQKDIFIQKLIAKLHKT